MDKHRRDEIAVKVLQVLERVPLFGVVIGIRMDHLNAMLLGRPDLMKVFGSAYGSCLHWVMSECIDFIAETNLKTGIAFVHEENDFVGEAQEIYRLIKRFDSSGVPITFSMGSKSDYPPPQAADVLAFEGAKFILNLHGGRSQRRPWKMLAQEGQMKVRGYDSRTLPVLIGNLERHAAKLGSK